MPYRVTHRGEWTCRSRFAHPRARLRIGATRFELSFWDYEPLFVILAAAPVLIGVAFTLGHPLAAGGLLLASIVTSRRAFVATPMGSWLEKRVLGLCWHRIALGFEPQVSSGAVWDWCEIAITPSQAELRASLRDGERAVLAEWSTSNLAADADAERMTAIARAEVERLHRPH